jgi:hypothetical protein
MGVKNVIKLSPGPIWAGPIYKITLVIFGQFWRLNKALPGGPKTTQLIASSLNLLA